ncbi:hypothetical protein PO909_015896 [Leuciscus waleckii]
MCRGRRCLVLMTVCLGLICVLLLVFITLQHIHCSTITAERDLLKSYKNTVEEFNHTINSLQDNYTDLMTEKDQLKNNFNSLSQKELELETRIKYPTAEKGQSQNSSHSLSQELETRDKDLFAEKSQLETRVKDLTTEKSQLETRANDCTAEKSHLETRVNDLNAEKGQLQKSFDSLSQKKLELETRVKDLTAEKDQLNQTKLELESNVTSLSEELKKEKSKQGNPRGPVCLFKSNESSWSESRQFCRDHGGDLVIINTEEKQKHITSFIKERVWIGLSKTENKGTMKWVDNSTLEKGFWFEDEPKNAGRNEDCVELMPLDSTQNWNDLPCSEKRKGICEK